MKTVLNLPDMAFPIKVEQRANGRFRVTYGAEIRDDLDYNAAAKELGLCVFHALACDGKLDSDK